MKKTVRTPAFVLYIIASLVALTICLIGCHKSPDTAWPWSHSLVGQWELVQTFASPGVGGTGTGWETVEPSKVAFLTFNKDGSMTMTPYNIYSASQYKATSDSTLNFVQIPGATPLTTQYHLIGDTLFVYPLCFAPCGQKYVLLRPV